MQTKTTLYGPHKGRCFDSDILPGNVRPTRMAFTPKEKKLYQILSQNNSDSIWGIAIRAVCLQVRVTGDITRFRNLIKQLRSQGRDCPESMKMIVGDEAYRLLTLTLLNRIYGFVLMIILGPAMPFLGAKHLDHLGPGRDV